MKKLLTESKGTSHYSCDALNLNNKKWILLIPQKYPNPFSGILHGFWDSQSTLKVLLQSLYFLGGTLFLINRQPKKVF